MSIVMFNKSSHSDISQVKSIVSLNVYKDIYLHFITYLLNLHVDSDGANAVVSGFCSSLFVLSDLKSCQQL